jgi:hypothetical protein
MRIKELYDNFKEVIDTIDEISTFYFIEGYNRNDNGEPDEYPKVVMLQPIAVDNTDRVSTFDVVMEFVNIHDITEYTVLEESVAELETIDGCEVLAREFLKQLQTTKPTLAFTDYRFQSIHNEYSDQVYGVELSFKVKTGNNLC